MLINDRTPEIAAFLCEWKDNRAMILGERAVKAPGARFLPCDENMSPEAYANMVQRTPFFPAAARTHEGVKAFAARKPSIVNAPENTLDILNTITARGYTIDKLAAKIFSELLITNFVGLVVDYPASTGPMSKAQAIDKGVRPYIGMYTAENILGIETGVINNRQRVTRVRLFDNAAQTVIRELRLDNGLYTVTIWKLNGGQWTIASKLAPTGPGVIDEIPFTLVATEEDFDPSKAPLSDVCSLNKQLFLASSNLAQCHWWLSSPIPYIIKKLTDEEKAGQISIAPGIVWQFDCDPKEAVVGFLEWAGGQVAELRAEVEAIKSDLSKIGARMLAPDKAVAEAADTEHIRRAAENAIQQQLTQARDRGLNDALAWVSWWLGLAEDAITFEASTDYNVIPRDAPTLAFIKSLKESGDISRDALLDIVIDEGILPETFDKEADAKKVAEETADRPPAIVMPVGTNPSAVAAAQDNQPPA